jgi:hypothetical protein
MRRYQLYPKMMPICASLVHGCAQGAREITARVGIAPLSFGSVDADSFPSRKIATSSATLSAGGNGVSRVDRSAA